MTLDEAMTTLVYVAASPSYPAGSDAFQALKLGIEALKGIKKVRTALEPYVTALLPGETEH